MKVSETIGTVQGAQPKILFFLWTCRAGGGVRGGARTKNEKELSQN